MDVLVACEEIQVVCKAFRERGHEAFSCDQKDCSGGHPEWHMKCDALLALNYRKWDLVIAHPPCTQLCNSGVRWLSSQNLWNDLKDGINFFRHFQLYGQRGGRICIENPIPHKYATDGFYLKKNYFIPGIGIYNQSIQPYQFGHAETKKTCLWLYNLPPLYPTTNSIAKTMQLPLKERAKIHYASPGDDRAKIRSKTYSGIAEAMADQWGHF